MSGPVYHHDIEQGTDAWFVARCGVLTASEVKDLFTKTGRLADNETSKRLVFEKASQRINKFVEPSFTSFTTQRGHDDEAEAKVVYSNNIAPVEGCGFITNDEWGFKLGYSPDGLVEQKGLIECKSRLFALQIKTICEQIVPDEFMAQCQTGLMVSKRDWLDFISFPAEGGMKMMVLRVEPDLEWQQKIIDVAEQFEERVQEAMQKYEEALSNPRIRFFDTERREELEIMI